MQPSFFYMVWKSLEQFECYVFDTQITFNTLIHVVSLTKTLFFIEKLKISVNRHGHLCNTLNSGKSINSKFCSQSSEAFFILIIISDTCIYTVIDTKK